MKGSSQKAPESSGGGGGAERRDGGTSTASAAAAAAAGSLGAGGASGPGDLDITALLLACASPGAQPRSAEALLDSLAAADPSGEATSAALAVSDPAGLTPLLAAARRPGWVHVVRRMLSMGADPLARLLASGNTAAHLAAAAGQVDALRELLPQPRQSGGSEGDGSEGTGISSLANACNTNGDTPLMFACGGDGPRQVAAVALLLQRGADLGAANREGVTAAMVAAGRGHELVLTALERHHKQQATGRTGGNKSAKCSGSALPSNHPFCALNAQGNAPLVFAARAGQAGCVRLLLSSPEVERQVFERNAAGRTPREEAQHAGHLEVARMLEEFEQQAALQRERLAAELAAESGPPAHKHQRERQPSKQQQQKKKSSSGTQQQKSQHAAQQQEKQQEERQGQGQEEKQEQQQNQQEPQQGEVYVPVKAGAAVDALDEWVVVNGRKGQRPAAAAAPAAIESPDDHRPAERSGPSLKAKQEGSGVSSSGGVSSNRKPAVTSGGWAAVVRGNNTPAAQPTVAGEQTLTNPQPRLLAEPAPQQQHPVHHHHHRHPSWIAAAERALADLCPAASDLDLQPQHVLGLGLEDLSPSQLEALEMVHRGALARVADARLQLAERAMEARLAEEAARQREIAALAAAMKAR